MYKVIFKKIAIKQLSRVPTIYREQITLQIHKLAVSPDYKDLDVKKLSGMPGFRLRVGIWRIIFDKDNFLKIIAIQNIGPRGGVYK